MQEHIFELLVDKVPYEVKVTPFQFNGETRFTVSYNGGEDHTFTWDSSIGRLAPIDDASSTMPLDLEQAIAQRLQSSDY